MSATVLALHLSTRSVPEAILSVSMVSWRIASNSFNCSCSLSRAASDWFFISLAPVDLVYLVCLVHLVYLVAAP
jgi:hypothetical protein